ncbi:MAG: aminotransferase class I/II-fold pyridoxal phosphate-dependent enzyme [Dermatophilaceae bacterium]
MDLHRLTPEQLRARRTQKWSFYPPDILPMWVAEMDYPLAPPVAAALRRAVDAEVVGYPSARQLDELAAEFVAWQARTHGWSIAPDSVHAVPDVMAGVSLAVRYFSGPSDPVVIPTPVYMPFFDVIALTGRPIIRVPMAWDGARHTLDLSAIDAALAAGGRTVLISSPHNPLGRVYSRDELAALAAVVERHGARVVSDEIHSPLVFETPHIPYAAVSPAAAAHSITVTSASKAWNVPGLRCAQVVTTAPGESDAWRAIPYWEKVGVATMGIEAGIAAFRDGDPWREEVVATLAEHRTLVADAVASMPGITTLPNEGTYLQWLDCTELALDVEPTDFFLAETKVAINPGVPFGAPAHRFGRLNFATTRPLLQQGLERIAAAVSARYARG